MHNRSTDIGNLSDEKVLQETFGLTEKQSAIITGVTACGNISKACRDAGVSRQLHYESLRHSEGYRQAFQHTLKTLGHRVIEVMAARAIEGDLVIHGGEIVTDEDGKPLRKFDTVLQIFLSKALAKLSDQPPTAKYQHKDGPQVHIHMPEQSAPPRIEVIDHDTQHIQCSDESPQD